MKKKTKRVRIYVDPDFKKVLEIGKAESGINSMVEYTKKISKGISFMKYL